ncbi:MAG: hypothetical protein PHQ44_07170 [Anaerovibrio sp.]|nr:hypothetical protein [Anaerovibrio sp.]
MNKHKIMRKHISAAKGWLSQAEDSIEQENELRGDLSLMLAQAELQRAQEKNIRRLWLRWLRRAAPLAAALLLALGYVLYLQPHGSQDSSRDVPAQPAAFSGAAGEKPRPLVQIPEAQPEEPAEQMAEQPVPPAEDEQAAPTEQISQQPQAEPAVPTAEMQQLMRSAGSILRE